MDWIVAGIGLLGGFLSGLFGIGGATVFVPLLIIFRHFDPHKAIGTSLMIIIFTSIFGAFFHSRAAMVDVKVGVAMGLCSILGVWFGAKLSIAMDAGLLQKLFAIFLVVMALKLFFAK